MDIRAKQLVRYLKSNLYFNYKISNIPLSTINEIVDAEMDDLI